MANKPAAPSPAPSNVTTSVKSRATGDVRLEQQQQQRPASTAGSRPRSAAPSPAPPTPSAAAAGPGSIRYSTAARPTSPRDGFETVDRSGSSNRGRSTPVPHHQPPPQQQGVRRPSPFAGAKPVPAKSPAPGRFGALVAEEEAGESPVREMPHAGWPIEQEDSPREAKTPAEEGAGAGKLIAVFEEYVLQHNLQDVLDELQSAELLVALISHALDQRKSAQALVPVLQATAVPVIPALQQVLANLSEMAVDLPVVHEHAGIILAPWLGEAKAIFPDSFDSHASRAIHWALTHVPAMADRMALIVKLGPLPAIGSHGGDRLKEMKALIATAPLHTQLLALSQVDGFANEAKELIGGQQQNLTGVAGWTLCWNLLRLLQGKIVGHEGRVKGELLPQLIPCLALIPDAEWAPYVLRALSESPLEEAEKAVIATGLKELGI